jgi:hypothetical protein
MDKRKRLKTFEQYLSESLLMSDVLDTDTKSLNDIFYKQYERRYLNQLLMIDVVDNYINESLEDFALKVSTQQWDNDPENFYKSFMSSKKLGYLTPYSLEDLKEFSLYKVKDYNIGFAIKKDGDIILVHNNEPTIKGIGKFLLNKAIMKGGKKLDHFDGFLTGFYKSIGFNLKSNDEFLDEYAPESWDYKKVDINNPKLSIYVNELKVNNNQFNLAKERYLVGKPDVVYRQLVD